MSSFIGPYYWSHEPFFSYSQAASHPASEKLEQNTTLEAESNRQKKRERIACDYLQGRPPFIQSSQLKGPFDSKSGWENPWVDGKKDGTQTVQGRADTHDYSYITIKSQEDESIIAGVHVETINTANQRYKCNQKRLAPKNWLKTNDTQKRLKVRSHNQSPTPAARRVSNITAVSRDDGHSRFIELSSTHKCNNNRSSSGLDAALKDASSTPHPTRETSKSAGEVDEGALDLKTEDAIGTHAAEDTDSSVYSGSFHYHKIHQKNMEQPRIQARHDILDAFNDSSPAAHSSSGIGLGISTLPQVITQEEQHSDFDQIGISASKTPNRYSRRSMTQGWIDSHELGSITASRISELDHSPDPLSIDTPVDDNARILLRSSNSLAVVKERQDCSLVTENVLGTSPTSPEPEMRGTLDGSAAIVAGSSLSHKTQSPDILGLSDGRKMESSSYRRDMSSPQASLSRHEDFRKSHGHSFGMEVSDKKSSQLVQSPWQVPESDLPGPNINLKSNASATDVPDVVDKNDLEIVELGSSICPSASLPQHSSLSHDDLPDTSGCYDPVPSRPFQDLMSPSPSRDERSGSVNKLPSTQLLIDTTTLNPWANAKAPVKTPKAKKRVSFGVSPEAVGSRDLNSGTSASMRKTNYDIRNDSNSGVRAIAGHSQQNEATRKPAMHLEQHTSSVSSSPAIEAMAEAFVAADRESVCCRKPLSSPSHESVSMHSTTTGYHSASDREDMIGDGSLHNDNQNYERQHLKSRPVSDLTFAISPSGQISTVRDESNELNEEKLGVIIEEMEDFLENWDVDTELRKVRGRGVNSGLGYRDSVTREQLSPVWNR